MNKILLGLTMASLLATGCWMGKNSNSSFSTVGTSIGTTGTAAKGEAGGTINLEETAPPMVEKGKTVKWVIKASRADTKTEKAYKGDIRLEFDTTGAKGLKIDSAVIPAGQDSVEVMIAAPADFAGGVIVVNAKGEGTDPYVMQMSPTVK